MTLPREVLDAIEAGPALIAPSHPDAIKHGKKRETAGEFATRIALLASSETRAQEPVAWRWRVYDLDRHSPAGWCYGPEKPTNLAPYIAWEFEPLFNAPLACKPKEGQR